MKQGALFTGCALFQHKQPGAKKMSFEIFVKPNGTEIPVNAESRETALGLGWVPKVEPKKEDAKEKRTTKKKG